AAVAKAEPGRLGSPEDRAAFERIAAHQVRAEGSAGARGLNRALEFIDRATPELLESLRKPLSQKEFARLTGLKKTSETFRSAFRDTLSLYAEATARTPATPAAATPSTAERSPDAPPPGSQAATTPERPGDATG